MSVAKSLVRQLVALFLLVVVAGQAEAAILYDQPNDFPVGGAFASQNDPGFGSFATTFDNFTLAAAANITDVHWTGGYFNPPAAGTITDFTIGFWADDAGMPDAAPLLTQTIAGNANETSLGTDDNDTPVFTYDLDLTTAFAASAGATYWISIQPTMTNPPQWGQYTGTGGDGASVQEFFGARSQLANDLAFTLTGEPAVAAVPEPISMTTWSVLGLLGLAARWRRKRVRSA